MPRLSATRGLATLISLLAGCQNDPSGPDRSPVGLIWGSGASGAFVEDTVPLVVFFRDSANDPIGLPRPAVTWTSSNPAVLEIVSDTLAVALATGTAVLTAATPDPLAWTVDVPFEVIPRWQGCLVWIRQPTAGVQPGIAVQEFPGHQVTQLPDVGYPGAGNGDPYLSSDGRYAAANGTRPIAPGADRTIFIVDLVTGDVNAPLDTLPGHQFSAAWFPGDTLIAFLGRAVTGYEVFTARPDGSEVQQRTQLGAGTPPFFDFTPEGNLVLEVSSDLFELTLAGDLVRRLTSTAEYEGNPSVSPDGTMIAYGKVTNDANHVWVMNRDGWNPRRLLPDVRTIFGVGPPFLPTSAASLSPSWSPDGEFVLVTWYIDASLRADGLAYEINGDLYAIRVADGLAIRLTRAPTVDAQPFFR
jgi:hypothetical protein